MKKRQVLMLIIFVCFAVEFILSEFVIGDFPPIVSFILLVPFFLMLYFNPRYRSVRFLGLISIVCLLSNIYLNHYLLDGYSMGSYKIWIIAQFSFFSSFIANITAFVIILQTKPRDKYLKLLFLFITMSTLFLFSYYRFPIIGILTDVFGPNPIHIANVYWVVYYVQLVFRVLIMIAQLMAIYRMDRLALVEIE